MKLLITGCLTFFIAFAVNAQDAKPAVNQNAESTVNNQTVVLADETLGLKESIYDFEIGRAHV